MAKTTPKKPNVITYSVMMDWKEVVSGANAGMIILLCKERHLITSKALCRKDGFWTGSRYQPISKFPEFARYVRDTTIEEAEKNPGQNTVCYLSQNGDQTGPFAPAQIRSMWNAGAINSDTLFYHEDLGVWRPVRKFCENEKWNFSPTSESQLLKQVVNEQQKATSQLGAIRWVLVGVFVIPFILYQCSQHR